MDKPAYILPGHLREELKKPIGFLVSGEDVYSHCTRYDIVISVGDHISHSLLEHNIQPQLMIIDFKTQRKNLCDHKKKLLDNPPKYSIKHVDNPAGVLTKELMNTIQSLCAHLTVSDHIQLHVDGEEDLAALPAILYAPANATIIYGMPYKGVVIVPSTEEYKEKIRFILSEM